MDRRKYALLDADFVIKTIISRKEDGCHLLDLLVADDSFSYVCHEITASEISVHDECGASVWLKRAVDEGRIRMFSDDDILRLLCSSYGISGMEFYRDYLRTACDAMSTGLYSTHYGRIEEYDPVNGSALFLRLLQKCDNSAGHGRSLGESKVMVLLQTLRHFHPGRVYLFCSDDRRARAGMFSIARIPCKSVISIYWDLYADGVSKEEACEYFRHLKNYITRNGADSGNIRVYSRTGNDQLRLPCQQVFDEIFEGRFDSLQSGMLKYR